MVALASFRNYIGVAPIINDTLTTEAIAAAATSVTVLSATGISSSSSVIFLDGNNTEVVAVSSVSSLTLTIGATTYAHPQGCYIFVQPTASVGPTVFIPVTGMKVPDTYEQLYDRSYVGSAVEERGVAQGIRTSSWQIDGSVYGDTIGYFLASFFGAEDYTAGSGTPNSHIFAALNTGNGQPVKMAWYVFDGVNMRVTVGRTSDLSFKFDPKALITYSAKILGRASGVVGTAAPSFSAITPAASWRSSLTLAGSYSRTPMTAEFTFTRTESENIPTLSGTQDPFDSFVGPINATMKTSIVKDSDSQLANYISGTTYTYLLSFLQGTGTTQIGLAIQASAANTDTEEPVLNGKAYNTEDISATFVGNATDANSAGGGLSPCRVTLLNLVSTGVYLA
jgi:hypothetical protein